LQGKLDKVKIEKEKKNKIDGINYLMEGITERWIWKGLIERLKIGDQVIELDLHLSDNLNVEFEQNQMMN
jgi:hypothetical protein